MYGAPVSPPKDAIVLRQHWQYQIKRDGTRRARNCCDGSPRAAPALHRFAKSYSSCVEQPIQRLFLLLSWDIRYMVAMRRMLPMPTHLRRSIPLLWPLMMPMPN
eukprot:scaffold946_cov73-Cylindrotheca_fusiformis.AAC.1